MAVKTVKCKKCGKEFETKGVFSKLRLTSLCPECRAELSGKVRRAGSFIAKTARSAGHSIAETYSEIGGPIAARAGEIGREITHAASDMYKARQERKAQEKAEADRLKQEEESRKEQLRREVIITAASSLVCQIKRNLGYVSANIYATFTGKDEAAISEAISAKELDLLDELRLKAHESGANAVIGINVQKSLSITGRRTFGSDSVTRVTGVLLSAYGTALEIAPKSPQRS